MDDDMFEVFEGGPSKDAAPRKTKKRQANGDVKSPVPVEDASMSDAPAEAQGGANENSAAETLKKRQKRDAEPEPIVTDDFETEQSREVAAAAGLQAQTQDGQAVVLSHQVRHQVALPPDYDYVPISEHKPPTEPARTWPFALDPFQQVSIASIQRNESVLVSAHTSAGKTVVAEYAIAQCLKNNQRVIYTSPIKALSNQKYREFMAEFGDVGLMTGDVTINPTATCLVMTTEILRSMLYRGSEIMREVAWVVFDEVHYLRDKSRGVVWEETIILLPDKVRYVFLSATIPNSMQFAEWITKTHSQPCHVVYTDFRPTPLQHYFFPAGADGIHLVVDEKGMFREENFQKAMSSIADKAGTDAKDFMAKRKGKGKDKKTNTGGNREQTDIYKIVKMIMVKSYNPVIVFSFSKRECENYALAMSSLAFNDESEKAMVTKVFNSAIEMLSEEDRQLPQIQNILPLLRRGVGVHHSGLLPILKETIEILFQEGLIKVLFATETFSIGLNMPAKTVVFTSVRKFDGVSQRWVTPSEFIQMSGRAGRRGLDDRGIVIMMIDEQMEPAVAKEIVRGQQDNLNSAFHLGYNMILNLMRVEGISPEFMLERCFYQFQSTAGVSNLEKHHDFGWGAVVAFAPRKANKGEVLPPQESYIVDVLLIVGSDNKFAPVVNDGLPPGVRPPAPGDKGKMEVVPVVLNCIESIGHLRVFLPNDLKSTEQRNNVRKALNEVEKRFPDGIAILDPIENMNIKDESFKRLLRKIEVLESRLLSNPLHNSPRLPELYSQYAKKIAIGEKIKNTKKEIANALSVIQLDELKSRKRVLRRLGFIDDADVVQLKARVACEISTGDELVLSELLFNRFFNELTPEQCAACLSCFIFEEKTQEVPALKEELAKPYREIQQQARVIAKMSQESKLTLNEEEYLKSFKYELMEVVFAWSKGATFSEICKMTDVYEGSLIRLFRRLEELLRQIAQAAKVMGSEELEQKFTAALELVRRDLVAAQSLYL
ncbi:hypothetical protein GGP41_003344 [Bipolaris sorokiniana]|uniref:ATP-dependent RNA helicase DOB1 n=1 Tax=Cochliobolus sativus TaxID=45130 RepID=A0A8H5ZD10_COCSA|nr:hypothetical protein GGP41_003344 [Bipolaris sorokiniana]